MRIDKKYCKNENETAWIGGKSSNTLEPKDLIKIKKKLFVFKNKENKKRCIRFGVKLVCEQKRNFRLIEGKRKNSK